MKNEPVLATTHPETLPMNLVVLLLHIRIMKWDDGFHSDISENTFLALNIEHAYIRVKLRRFDFMVLYTLGNTK